MGLIVSDQRLIISIKPFIKFKKVHLIISSGLCKDDLMCLDLL